MLILALLAGAPLPAHAQMGGGPDMGAAGPETGEDFGPADGKPRAPTPPKPITRERFDKVVTAMFQAADANRDGTVTVPELHALVEARRNEVISGRFARIDSDRNGAISRDEFFAWQRQMGSAAVQDSAALGDREGPISEAVVPEAGHEPMDRMLDALIEPITGTLIAKANTNYDAGLSLSELLAYEGALFDAADSNHDGYLVMPELRVMRRGGAGGMQGPGGPGAGPTGAPSSGQ